MYKTTVELSWLVFLAKGSKEPSTIFSIENDPRQFDQEKTAAVSAEKKEGKKGEKLEMGSHIGE